MIAALVTFAIAALAAAVAWRSMRGVFDAAVFARTNYRGQALPTAAGVIIPLVSVTLIGIIRLVVEPWNSWATGRWVGLGSALGDGAVMAALVVGFSFLGLLDDLGGVGESGGFSGHLRALTEGRLTTGAVKLFGGAALSIAVLGSSQGFGAGRQLVDAAIICLAANLFNLLDRAPGRTTKCALVALAILAVLARDGRIVPVAIPVGAGAGLLVPDLREELMLGDAGSNALGAAVGFGAVLIAPGAWRWLVLAGLLMLNLVSEAVSFSTVIDRVAVLRRFDRWGSLRA